MKRVILSFVLLCVSGMMTLSFGSECSDLMSKYSAPNPAKKTMAQLKRWVSRKVDNPNDKSALESCLVAAAADNPNKDQVAGGGR